MKKIALLLLGLLFFFPHNLDHISFFFFFFCVFKKTKILSR